MKTSKTTQLSVCLALMALAALVALVYVLRPAGENHGSPTDTAGSPTAARTPWGWTAQVLLLAGDGHAGLRDGAGAQARFADPYGLAQDRQGQLYVSDAGENNRIRRIGREGEVSTWAGSTEGFKDGPASSAQFNTPSGLALDAQGNLYVADTGNHAIRKITPEGQVSTLAGTGEPGFRDGPAAQAQFNGPLAVAIDGAGRVLVADSYNDRIRVITPDGQVGTLAGGESPGYQDGPGLAARFDTPSALALDAAGQLWIADTRNDAIRKLDASGMVSTVQRSDPKDEDALLRRPLALAVTHDGLVYVAMMSGGTVLQIAPDGQQHVLLGKTETAPLSRPTALLLDGPGLLLSDSTSRRIHRIQPAGSSSAAKDGPVGPAADAALPDTRQRWPLQPQLAWHEVVGTPGEVRGDGQGAARDHLHAGLDVRGDVGATVLAMADAKVSSPLATWGFGGLNEGLSLDGLSYVHMRVGRSARGELFDAGKFQLLRDAQGKPERMRVRRGTRFHAGEALGSINGMAHVHLNLGAPGYLRSPFALGFAEFIDRQPPHIVSIALITAKGERLKQRERGRLLVPRDAGGLQIVVEAWDQVDGNEARRRLGLLSLGYQLLRADGQPAPGFEAPRIGIDFSRLPFSDDAPLIAYAEGSGITVHGSKQTRFLYQVANTVKDGRAVEGRWQPGELAAGDYTLRIFARDHAGNLARQGTELALRLQ